MSICLTFSAKEFNPTARAIPKASENIRNPHGHRAPTDPPPTKVQLVPLFNQVDTSDTVVAIPLAQDSYMRWPQYLKVGFVR